MYGLEDGYDTPYRGGLFLLARMSDKHTALAKEAGLLVNPGEWGRTGQFVRMCYCLEDSRFNIALERLKKFLAANYSPVKGGNP
jgi:hypothetical protein